MGKCSLCGRFLLSNSNCYGLFCLKKMCLYTGMDDIKNLRMENSLNNNIQKITNKEKLSKLQKQELTNRYLTFKMLSEIDIDYYKELAKSVETDIKKINNKTKVTEIPSNNIITLKEAYEIYKLYNRYKKFKEEADIIMSKQRFEELQNLPWDTVMFAYSAYYNRKPHLSTLLQHIQFALWYLVILFSDKVLGYKCGAEFLQHSLNLKPKDKYITKGEIIDKIKNDVKFKKKIKDIIEEYGNKNTFDTLDKEHLNYADPDLFFALNNTDINVKGKRKNNKWYLDITITDRYDFTDFKEITEYYSGNVLIALLGSTLNNAAMLSDSFNVISEYDITIKFELEV